MADNWQDPQFAEQYAQNAADVDTNWYEHSVNFASLVSLMPAGSKSLLDFGCGSGDFTAQLHAASYDIAGCDGSPAMIELAKQQYKNIDFFVWDGVGVCPKNKMYDVIVSKLTLHFVEDLHQLAAYFLPALNQKGSVLISVPHPISTLPKITGVYSEKIHYDTGIGAFGMHATMIHRSLQDYIDPFLNNGFVLTGLLEPVIPHALITKYAVKDAYAQVPRRLNLRFQKIA